MFIGSLSFWDKTKSIISLLVVKDRLNRFGYLNFTFSQQKESNICSEIFISKRYSKWIVLNLSSFLTKSKKS